MTILKNQQTSDKIKTINKTLPNELVVEIFDAITTEKKQMDTQQLLAKISYLEKTVHQQAIKIFNLEITNRQHVQTISALEKTNIQQGVIIKQQALKISNLEKTNFRLDAEIKEQHNEIADLHIDLHFLKLDNKAYSDDDSDHNEESTIAKEKPLKKSRSFGSERIRKTPLFRCEYCGQFRSEHNRKRHYLSCAAKKRLDQKVDGGKEIEKSEGDDGPSCPSCSY
uniref:C2H2-type domain-containing protein n=1 Tax=Meloidogyne hapla TaxID=6305 RepID=A0A1I8BG05_MELHA